MTMARRMVMKVLALLLVPALLVACNPFGLRDLLEAATRSGLSIDPADVTMPAGATLTFSADGGVPGYTYSVLSGGGIIDAATGEYEAPLTAGTAVIRVTDAAGATADTGVTIEELVTGLSLSPASITISVNSALTFDGIGGTGPYSYDIIVPGSGSPDINLTTGYYVAGSTPGTDTVRVTDALAATATATVTVVALSSAVDYSVTSTDGLPASGIAGETIPGGVSFTVTNAGPGDGAASVSWTVYLSTNAALDGGDVVVDEGTTAALADDGSAVVNLSGTYPLSPLGAGFLIVAVDAADDTSPGNNTSTPKAFTLDPRPVDYYVSSVNHFTGTYTGAAVTGNFAITNAPAAAGSTSIHWFVYASTDTAVDGGDFLLQSGSRSFLGAGASAVIPIASTWPTTPGSYYLLAKISAADDVEGSNDTAWTSAAIPVTGAPPADIDYQVAAPTISGTVAGGPVSGTFTVTNPGTAAGSQTLYWTVYRSDDGILDTGSDPIMDMGSHAALGAGGSAPVAYDGTWPEGPDAYTLFAAVSAIDDKDPLDNESTGTFVNVTAPDVDYIVQAFSEISGAVAGDPINGTLQVRNAGTNAGSQPVAWTVYLSDDATLDPAFDLVVDAGTFAALGSGTSSAVIPFGGTWPVSPYPPWPWRLYLVIAAADEKDPSDNTSLPLPRTTSVPNADYDVLSVSSTGGTSAGGALAGTFNATNLGPHDGTQAVPWRAYVSTDAFYDAGIDTLVDSGVIASPGLASGASSGAVAFSGTWPTGAGTWYLVVVLDAGDDQVSANDEGASGMVTTTAPNVDYDVLAVTNTGGTTAGGALAGSFTVQNIGTDPGNRLVYWIAYRSDDPTLIPGSDPVIDSGSITALAAGATSSPVVFTNAWPAALAARDYYLIVRVFAADDVLAANDTQPSAMVTVNPPDIDYDVLVINNTGSIVAGGLLSGTFQVQNTGTVNGSATLYWFVYRSLDTSYDPVFDPLIDSDSIPSGLTAGNSANPTFSGTWPEDTVAHTYYYFVRLVAADDIDAGNNDQFSAGYLVNPPAAYPDYTVTAAVTQPVGMPGAALAGIHTFQVQNNVANPGTKTITWRVYASRDAVLDGLDTQIASGTTPALVGGGNSGDILFGGTWPAIGAYYRLIVLLQATDDTNPSNDTWISGPIEAPELYDEAVNPNNGDFGPTTVPLANVYELGVTLLPGQLVRITGLMDAKMYVDTYKLTFGAGTTGIHMTLTWATASDACNLYLFDELGGAWVANSAAINIEGAISPPLPSLAPYYISAYFNENNVGAAYQLELVGE